MTVAYVTADEVLASMPDIPWSDDAGRKQNLDRLAKRASRMVDAITKRGPGAYATGTAGTVRYFEGHGTCLLIDELAAAPSEIAVDEVGDGTYTVWAATDYILVPYNHTPYQQIEVDLLRGTKSQWYGWPRAVRITGPWGFSVEAPEDLKEAVLIQTVRWMRRGQQGFADAAAIAELSQIRFVKKLDPDVEAILWDGGYVRMTV